MHPLQRHPVAQVAASSHQHGTRNISQQFDDPFHQLETRSTHPQSTTQRRNNQVAHNNANVISPNWHLEDTRLHRSSSEYRGRGSVPSDGVFHMSEVGDDHDYGAVSEGKDASSLFWTEFLFWHSFKPPDPFREVQYSARFDNPPRESRYHRASQPPSSQGVAQRSAFDRDRVMNTAPRGIDLPIAPWPDRTFTPSSLPRSPNSIARATAQYRATASTGERATRATAPPGDDPHFYRCDRDGCYQFVSFSDQKEHNKNTHGDGI